MKKNHTRISTGGDVEDRISDLPDEIIHQILALVPSPFRPSKLSVLSKRWNQVWRSYPILEFNQKKFRRENQSPEEENFSSVAAASCKKFFQQRIDSSFPTEAVQITITRTGDFVDQLLDLTSKISPRSLEIRAINCRYSIPTRFLLDCGDNLKVLILEGCDFPLCSEYSGLAFGFSLKVLNLKRVSFPADGILNSMIASAPLLESLTLGLIEGVSRFRVRDHQKLKVVKVGKGFECIEFEIVGARSLESLRFFNLDLGRSEMSSLPNLRVVHIGRILPGWTDDEGVSNLHISEFPSLESLTFDHLCGMCDVSVVVSNQLWEARLTRSPYVIETEASTLANFNSFISKMGKTRGLSLTTSQALKQFLNELSQFRPTLQLKQLKMLHLLGRVETNDLLPAPVIDRLKFESNYLYYIEKRLLDHLLCACHPILLCLVGEQDRSPNATLMWAIEYICKQFMERAHCTRCRDACLCWRSQLKDAKMVTRVTRSGVEEENVVDIGRDIASSLADGTRVSFILTWD